jgi:nucleotide-binding universal stress UspA family protein
MFQTVLICTDLQDGMQRLMERVACLGKAGAQKIIFLHCVPIWQEGEIPREDTSAIANARAELNRALHQVPQGLEVVAEVKSGTAVDCIVQMAETYQVDAIFLGAHTRSLLTEKLFGSTTAAISNQLDIPLIILRPELVSTYTEAELALRCENLFRYLLVPVHHSDSSNYLLKRVQHILEQNPNHKVEQCLLLCIFEEYSQNRRIPVEYEIQAAQDTLDQAKVDLEALGLTVKIEIRRGERLAELFNVAMVHDITAIAITSHKTSVLLDWSIPNFGNEVLRRSWHPIIFFPT